MSAPVLPVLPVQPLVVPPNPPVQGAWREGPPAGNDYGRGYGQWQGKGGGKGFDHGKGNFVGRGKGFGKGMNTWDNGKGKGYAKGAQNGSNGKGNNGRGVTLPPFPTMAKMLQARPHLRTRDAMIRFWRGPWARKK